MFRFEFLPNTDTHLHTQVFCCVFAWVIFDAFLECLSAVPVRSDDHSLCTTPLLGRGSVGRSVCVFGEDENEKQLDFQDVGVWQVYSGAVVNDFYWRLEDLCEACLRCIWMVLAHWKWEASFGENVVCVCVCVRTDMLLMSCVRVPLVPPVLPCCHGNCSGSMPSQTLCKEGEPTWQCRAVRTRHQTAV